MAIILQLTPTFDVGVVGHPKLNSVGDSLGVHRMQPGVRTALRVIAGKCCDFILLNLEILTLGVLGGFVGLEIRPCINHADYRSSI